MSSIKKLFGTDGIRGRSNQFPMLPEVVVRVGQALGLMLREEANDSKEIKVLIGKDTRLSGYMIEMALASGLNSAGVHVQLVGPLPTPGIGFLAQNMRADAGIVISASHNPYQDNGIKIFGSDGFKISKKQEETIERLVSLESMSEMLPPAEQVGRSKRIEDSTGRYVVFAKDSFPLSKDLTGVRIVLDTANGASYKVARSVFEELGAEVIPLGNQPNGTNINFKCGALYPETTAEAVTKYRADLGICLDGDADRVILVDEKGKIINGDKILAICGIHLKEQGKLDKNTVVCTKMSNFGLFRFFEKNGINVEQTDVGDKYVVERMREGGFVLGGEQSGHIIFLEHSTTGDGIVAALNVLAVMLQKSKKLSQLGDLFETTPQVMKNVKVKSKPPLEEILSFQKELEFVEQELDKEGRVIVRYSGTEALVRVLVEGPSLDKIEAYADRLGDCLKKELS